MQERIFFFQTARKRIETQYTKTKKERKNSSSYRKKHSNPIRKTKRKFKKKATRKINVQTQYEIFFNVIHGAQERYDYNYHIGRRLSLCAVIVGSSSWKFVWKVYVCAFCCVCRYLDELLSCCSHMIKVPNQLICRRICRPL